MKTEVHDLRPWPCRLLSWLRCPVCNGFSCSLRVFLVTVAVLWVLLFVGSAFAEEPFEPKHPDGPALIDTRQINAIRILAGLALFVCSLAVLDYLLKSDRQEDHDEGRVLPGHFPRRRG